MGLSQIDIRSELSRIHYAETQWKVLNQSRFIGKSVDIRRSDQQCTSQGKRQSQELKNKQDHTQGNPKNIILDRSQDTEKTVWRTRTGTHNLSLKRGGGNWTQLCHIRGGDTITRT